MLVTLLSSCYCFNKVTPTVSSVRQLRTSKPLPLCNNWGGDGRSYQVNGYYGFLSSGILKKDLSERFNVSASEDFSMRSNGQFGVRLEKYIPSLITNHAVLGIGLDYSRGFHSINYSVYGSLNSYRVQQHTAMISINHMTWVQGRTIGYLSLQGGIRQYVSNHSNQTQFIEQTKIKDPMAFAYRVGYGFQYYPKGLWGVSVEGGYGDAAYVRAGLFWWFH